MPLPIETRPQSSKLSANIGQQRSDRNSSFTTRRGLQAAKWQLPFLPTTTIGSFPQSAEVRNARQKLAQRRMDALSNMSRSFKSRLQIGLSYKKRLDSMCLYMGNSSVQIWLSFSAKIGWLCFYLKWMGSILWFTLCETAGYFRRCRIRCKR